MRLSIALLFCVVACASSGDEGADAGAVGEECTDTDNDPRNCGLCGRTCVIPNATAGCSRGECVIASCADGFSDDDSDPDNGCELAGEVDNPDQCGPQCTTECGSIGTAVCEGGVETSCEIPVEQCNGIDDNCDGTCDEGGLTACRVPVHRAAGDGHLYTTDLTAAQTTPFHIESQNYFHLYPGEAPGLLPVYLCTKSNGRGLLTSSASCESTGTVSLTLGYWAQDPQCGSFPLYRLFSSGAGDHFYTTSAAERDNAVTMFGYVSEGIAGHVWPAP